MVTATAKVTLWLCTRVGMACVYVDITYSKAKGQACNNYLYNPSTTYMKWLFTQQHVVFVILYLVIYTVVLQALFCLLMK